LFYQYEYNKKQFKRQALADFSFVCETRPKGGFFVQESGRNATLKTESCRANSETAPYEGVGQGSFQPRQRKFFYLDYQSGLDNNFCKRICFEL
jgi:hypothetical protein